MEQPGCIFSVTRPVLFYRHMYEAGILGVIQVSEVPIRALYDRENLDHLLSRVGPYSDTEVKN